MAIPVFQSLMLPVLEKSALGEVKVSDAVEKLAAKFALTNEEQADL